MIKIKKKFITEKYFAEKVCFIDSFRLINYIQCKSSNWQFGFFKYSKYTKIIDLNEVDESMKLFSNTTRNEIRKAIRHDVLFEIESDYEKFLKYYNDFAVTKGLKTMRKADIMSFQNILITKAVLNDEILCMHSYIYDKYSKRVRLLHSASLFRNFTEKEKKNLLSYANRFLHYYDMLYFKDNLFKYYDLGGYAFNTSNISLANINYFKDSFGGYLVHEHNYISWILLTLFKIKKIIYG